VWKMVKILWNGWNGKINIWYRLEVVF
jgi:hypothetical protein